MKLSPMIEKTWTRQKADLARHQPVAQRVRREPRSGSVERTRKKRQHHPPSHAQFSTIRKSCIILPTYRKLIDAPVSVNNVSLHSKNYRERST